MYDSYVLLLRYLDMLIDRQALRAAEPLTNSPFLSLTLPAPSLSSTWFPSASASIPATYCFALSIRDAPVRLVDATTGLVRWPFLAGSLCWSRMSDEMCGLLLDSRYVSHRRSS